MISIDRNRATAARQDLRIAIVGLGGAGSTVLDRLVLDGLSGASLVAINTDAQALAGSVAAEKIQLGRSSRVVSEPAVIRKSAFWPRRKRSGKFGRCWRMRSW